MFPEFATLPNLHACFHFPQHAISYGNLINSSVGVKEMVHRMFKNFAPHTNKKEIDFDLIKRYNTIESLRNVFDKKAEEPIYQGCKDLFGGWYMTSGTNNIIKGKLRFFFNPFMS